MYAMTRLKRIRPLHTLGSWRNGSTPPFKRTGKGSTPFGPTELAFASYRGGAVAQW